MIKTNLEGLLVGGSLGYDLYEEYLRSYDDVFSVHCIGELGKTFQSYYLKAIQGTTPTPFDTLISSYINSLRVGKLYSILNRFFNLEGTRVSEDGRLIMNTLEEANYSIEEVIKYSIEGYIGPYLKNIKYNLNSGGLVKISPLYNPHVLLII